MNELEKEIEKLQSKYWYKEDVSFATEEMLKEKIKTYLRTATMENRTLEGIRTDNGEMVRILFGEVLESVKVYGMFSGFYKFENKLFYNSDYQDRLVLAKIIPEGLEK